MNLSLDHLVAPRHRGTIGTLTLGLAALVLMLLMATEMAPLRTPAAELTGAPPTQAPTIESPSIFDQVLLSVTNGA